MKLKELDPDDRHAAATRLVAEAVAALLPRFAAQGLTPEAFLEGVTKGGAVGVMLATGASLGDIADALEEIADAMRADAPSDNDNGPGWPPQAN